MVLYSSTNFPILKPWPIISNFMRFDLGFWQTSKPFYRKLKYTEKVFKQFQRLSPFSRKMVLYLSSNLHILKPWAIISNHIRFDLGFWQAWKPFYRKLKYREKVLKEFQCLPRFPRELVLYSSTNFCNLKPWAIIPSLIRSDLSFWQAPNQFTRNSNIRRRFWKSFNVCLAFPGKWFCIRRRIFAF